MCGFPLAARGWMRESIVSGRRLAFYDHLIDPQVPFGWFRVAGIDQERFGSHPSGGLSQGFLDRTSKKRLSDRHYSDLPKLSKARTLTPAGTSPCESTLRPGNWFSIT